LPRQHREQAKRDGDVQDEEPWVLIGTKPERGLNDESESCPGGGGESAPSRSSDAQSCCAYHDDEQRGAQQCRTKRLVHVGSTRMRTAVEITGKHGLPEYAEQHEDGECQSDASRR